MKISRRRTRSKYVDLVYYVSFQTLYHKLYNRVELFVYANVSSDCVVDLLEIHFSGGALSHVWKQYGVYQMLEILFSCGV